MSNTKNFAATATCPRRHPNPRNGANNAANGHDSGFSSGSSVNTAMASTPESRTQIQEAAYRLMHRAQRIQCGEPVDEDEFIVPSIEADDFEEEHYQENDYGVEGSASISLEESDEEIVPTSIEPEDHGFESPRGSLKRRRDDSQTTDDDSDSCPQKKRSRGEYIPRGVNRVSRVTSGSVTDTYIKRASSDESYDFDEETTYYEDTADAEPTAEETVQYEDTAGSEPALAELGDSDKKNVFPTYDYVAQEDMKSPFHQAAVDFLEEQIDEAVTYFHKLLGSEYPAYKATVDLKVYRRRSWGVPNKEGRQLVKLLANKD